MNKWITAIGFFCLLLVVFYSYLGIMPYLNADSTGPWPHAITSSSGKRVGDITIDEKSNLIYITGYGHSSSSGPAIFVIDGQSHKVIEQIPFDVDQHTKIEIDPSSDILYISKNGIDTDNTITSMDIKSKKILHQTISEHWVSQIMIDSNDDYIYTIANSNISKLDKNSLKQIKTINLESSVRSINQDHSSNRIFVIASTAGRDSIYENPVFIIDKETFQIETVLSTDNSPFDIAVNSELNRIYVPNSRLSTNNMVTIFELNSLTKIDDISVSYGPNIILFNEFDNAIVVGHYNTIPIKNYNAIQLTIIDTLSHSIKNEFEFDNKLKLVDLNSGNGKLYGIMDSSNLVVINSDGSLTQIEYDDGIEIPYSLVNFTEFTKNTLVLIGAIGGIVVWYKITKIKIRIPKNSKDYQKISKRFYSVWEKRILCLIISISGLNLALLVLLPLSFLIPSEEMGFVLPITPGLVNWWVFAEYWAFTGTLLFFEITFGFVLVIAAFMDGEPIAFLGILIVYSILSIPIILAYNKIPWARRLVYAYFNSTQFSLLTLLIFMYMYNIG